MYSKSIKILFLSIFLLKLCFGSIREAQIQIEKNLNVIGYIEYHGYPVEEHQVITDDGYLLTLHRIPGKKGSKPILFQHGMLSSSASWILQRPDNSFAFLAHKAGFDIWLGNNRGNEYSKGHLNLTVTSEKYWDFSWHEMGVYDLPAVIDYILLQTKQNKLFFVGNSQGTTQFFVMCSERPEFNDKIHSAILISPIAYLGNQRSMAAEIFVKILVPRRGINKSYGLRQIGDRTQNESFLKKFLKYMIKFLITGLNPLEFNEDLFRIREGHLPSTTSSKNLYHYAQLIFNDGIFRQFDYGFNENLVRYQAANPPTYNLGLVTSPVALLYGENDMFINEMDLNLLKSHLDNIIFEKCVGSGFNHEDMLFGFNVKKYVFDDALEIISNISSQWN